MLEDLIVSAVNQRSRRRDRRAQEAGKMATGLACRRAWGFLGWVCCQSS